MERVNAADVPRSKAAKPQCPSDGRTILLVDDDEVIRSLTSTVLRGKGFRVHCCADASRASGVIDSGEPIDLLITDLAMPHRSGMELGIELKSRCPALPILLISGTFLDPVRVAELSQQGWSFLDKPFRLPQLLASVEHILGPQKGQPVDEPLLLPPTGCS